LLTPTFLFNIASWDEWKDALGDRGWNLLAILAVLLAAKIVFPLLIGRVLKLALSRAEEVGSEDPEGLRQRARTLMATMNWAFTIFLLLLGVTLVLDEVGVSVTALVAGVGLMGIAIGFGAQTLVRDVINGMFILLEDQYRVGEVVRVADTAGTVVEITPRRTVLRDGDGHLHSIPNGQIGIATNMTREVSRINFDIAVAYEEDLERAITVVDEVCGLLHSDRPADFQSAPGVLRVSDLGSDGVALRIAADVEPGKQWELTGELRRRLKARFDAERIEIPYRREVQVPFNERPGTRPDEEAPL